MKSADIRSGSSSVKLVNLVKKLFQLQRKFIFPSGLFLLAHPNMPVHNHESAKDQTAVGPVSK